MANDNETSIDFIETKRKSTPRRKGLLKNRPMLNLPLLPSISEDDEPIIILDDLAGRDPYLDAILQANPVQSEEEIAREVCKDLINSAYQNLLQNYGYEQFFRKEYRGVEEEELKYTHALRESSKMLKETFKELRDNTEDAETRKIFDGYFRTAHLLLKNRSAKAEYREEQRLLDVLNATEGEREVYAYAKETGEKALYFNILFGDRVDAIIKESKEKTTSKSQLEESVYALADAMRPEGIQQETKSQYHEAARIVVEVIDDELTEAQRRRIEAASIALGGEYTTVPAFERKTWTKKQTGTEEGTEPVYAVAPFYHKVQERVREHKGSKNALKRKAYALLAQEYEAGADEAAMGSYKRHVRYVLDNANTLKSAGLRAVPDVSADEAKTAAILAKGPRTAVRLRNSEGTESYAAIQAAEDAERVEYVNKPAPVVAQIRASDVDDSGDLQLAYVQSILAEVEAQAKQRERAQALKDAKYRMTFFTNYDSTNPPKYAEPPSVLDDDRVVEAQEVLEKRVRRAGFWGTITRAVETMSVAAGITALVGAFAAGLGYFAQISNNTDHEIYKNLASQEQAVQEMPTETIEEKVEAEAQKAAGKEQKRTRPKKQTITGVYTPSEDKPLGLKKGSYSREDATIELEPIRVDYTPKISDPLIRVEPRHDDIYGVLGKEAPKREGETSYKPKPQQETKYSLGVGVLKLPEYKPLNLQVAANAALPAIDYSTPLPQQPTPDKLVVFRF